MRSITGYVDMGLDVSTAAHARGDVSGLALLGAAVVGVAAIGISARRRRIERTPEEISEVQAARAAKRHAAAMARPVLPEPQDWRERVRVVSWPFEDSPSMEERAYGATSQAQPQDPDTREDYYNSVPRLAEMLQDPEYAEILITMIHDAERAHEDALAKRAERGGF